MEPMSRERMCEILENLITHLRDAKDAIVDNHTESAICLMSNVYSSGVGQVMDDLKRLRQPWCDHDWHIQSCAKNKVEKKCVKCFKYETVIV